LAHKSRVDAKGSSPLSFFFERLMKLLLVTSVRSDVSQCNLLVGTYEGINALISNAPPDVYQLLATLIPQLVARLQATVDQMPKLQPGPTRSNVLEVQVMLCASMQTIMVKLGKKAIGPHADKLMVLFLDVLNGPRAEIVAEEALRCVCEMTGFMEKNFKHWMRKYKVVLFNSLNNVRAAHVCSAAIQLVGDISRALEEELVPFCTPLMECLMSIMQNTQVVRSVKPQIIGCLADIALAVGPHFKHYLPYVVMMLLGAAGHEYKNRSHANIEYLQTLRESIFDAFTGIVQSLDTEIQQMETFVPKILQFVDNVAKDEDRSEGVTKAAVGCIGDLAETLGARVKNDLKRSSVGALVVAALKSPVPKVRATGEWARKVLQEVYPSY
jgi:importin subunit beta-1